MIPDEWPVQPAIPDDSWGVLGPTNCPYCRALRKDRGFAFGLVAAGLIVLVCVDRMRA